VDEIARLLILDLDRDASGCINETEISDEFFTFYDHDREYKHIAICVGITVL
jgi:hypothetical protein